MQIGSAYSEETCPSSEVLEVVEVLLVAFNLEPLAGSFTSHMDGIMTPRLSDIEPGVYPVGCRGAGKACVLLSIMWLYGQSSQP